MLNQKRQEIILKYTRIMVILSDGAKEEELAIKKI